MTVTPVVDYEPTTLPGGDHPAPAARRIGAGRLRRHPVRTARTARFHSAAAFTDTALRGILEVIDRRRPLTQLRTMLSPGLIDSVDAFTRAVPDRRSGATLRRVRLQSIVPDERVFEVSATYSRGPRLHALACRVEWISLAQRAEWQVVALHIG